jgi:hypothetical protein
VLGRANDGQFVLHGLANRRGCAINIAAGKGLRHFGRFVLKSALFKVIRVEGHIEVAGYLPL